MKQKLKDKSATILVSAATIILAGIAIFTAVRMYQLRQQSVSPAAPESAPAASGERDTDVSREMTSSCQAVQADCDRWGVYMSHPSDPFTALAEYKTSEGEWLLAGEGSAQGGENPQNYYFNWNIVTPPVDSEIRVQVFYNNREHTLSAGRMPLCETPTSTPTDSPTSTPTDGPTSTPTDGPTTTPTNGPTATPTVPVITKQCEVLAFTIGDEPTSTPTDGPTSTPTDDPTATPTKPIGGPSGTITPTSSPTATPSTPNQCNEICTSDLDCGTGLVCYKEGTSATSGVCRNNSCTGDLDCLCTTISDTEGELPPAGVGLPTMFAGALGVILIALAFAFAL